MKRYGNERLSRAGTIFQSALGVVVLSLLVSVVLRTLIAGEAGRLRRTFMRQRARLLALSGLEYCRALTGRGGEDVSAKTDVVSAGLDGGIDAFKTRMDGKLAVLAIPFDRGKVLGHCRLLSLERCPGGLKAVVEATVEERSVKPGSAGRILARYRYSGRWPL